MAIGYGFWDTGSVVPMSVVISVRGVVPMDVSSLANWEAYCFKRASSLGFNVWLQFVVRWMEGVWLYLFCHHILKSDPICWVCIWLTLGMYSISHTILYGRFKASCVFTFVEFNVFVCVIRHQNVDRCFPFYVMDAVDDVYIWVPSFAESSSVIK